MGGFVHRDEVRKDGSPVRDHMHVPFTPILDGRFNFKKMCPRTFYQSLHKDLGDYLEQHLGYRPEIELGDETRALRSTPISPPISTRCAARSIGRSCSLPRKKRRASSRTRRRAPTRSCAMPRRAGTSWWLRSPMASAGSRTCGCRSTRRPTDWSAFGKERTGLRETLRNWNPSLPMFAGSRVRDALNAAQSSIQSLLDAQERREQLERQLRSLETESGR